MGRWSVLWIWGLLFAGLFATVASAAPPLVFQSGSKHTPLLELYTSEGCSSCPPADRWLSKFAMEPDLWKRVVPVAFHVDYWDYIGWKDRFADATFGERQRRYARQGRAGGVYTPGLFVDGREWRGWRRGRQPQSSGAMTGPLTAVIDGSSVEVTFASATGQKAERVFLALLGMDRTTVVRAGENRGRTLRQDFVVLDLQEQRLDEAQQRSFSIPRDPDAGRQALATWVTDASGLNVLQATGGWLAEASMVSPADRVN